MDALRAYIAANMPDGYSEEDLEGYTFGELEQLIPADSLVSIDEHDLGPEYGRVTPRDVFDMS